MIPILKGEDTLLFWLAKHHGYGKDGYILSFLNYTPNSNYH